MNYTLIRSKRRTISLEVSFSGEIIVRAPKYCPAVEIERFVQSRNEWIAKQLVRQKQRKLSHPEPSTEQEAELIARAKSYLPERTSYYAEIMGLSPAGVKITGARTRFGSCSASNHICYSWRLMQYPYEAIDYVVVHEISHIVHKNHGKQFYALIASVLPDHKNRRALLKK